MVLVVNLSAQITEAGLCPDWRRSPAQYQISRLGSAAARRGYKLYFNSILQPATEHFNIKVLLTALWSSQKDIQETDTVMEQGTYTVTMKKESWRANNSFTRKHEYVPGQLYGLEGIAVKKINSIALKLYLKL